MENEEELKKKFTPEEWEMVKKCAGIIDKVILEAQAEAFDEGVRCGMTQYAWWKNGEEFVGTCGRTLKQAIIDYTMKEYVDIEEKPPTTDSLDISNTIQKALSECLERQFAKYGIPPGIVYDQKPSVGCILGCVEDRVYEVVKEYYK